MPLDLSSISNQISRMGDEVVSLDRDARVAEACQRLHTLDPEDLRARLAAAGFHTSWLVARPTGTLTSTYPPAQCPRNFSVVASDGSFISPDRHNPVRYYVVNTGSVLLSYGTHSDAELTAQGRLYYEEDDLYIPHDYKILPVEGARLGIRMAILELQALLDLAQKAPTPIVALRDGSLIFWALQAEEEEVRERFLRELVAILDQFRDRDIPLASYISYPNGRDVVNALRVGICPDVPVSCDNCSDRQEKREPTCESLGQVIDRWVFERELPVGYRSNPFESSSPILRHYGEHNWIGFFYLNVGGEIARLEAPRWVLQDERNLGLLHAVAYDQCQRGRGYPPALKEAHEQAVITATERQVVEDLVEETLMSRNVYLARSAKDTHKRERGL